MRRVGAKLVLTSVRRQGRCMDVPAQRHQHRQQRQQLRVDVFGFLASNPIG